MKKICKAAPHGSQRLIERLTWLFVSTSTPLTILRSFSSSGVEGMEVSIRMRLRVSEYCVRWSVAPSSESSCAAYEPRHAA
jgi:hypothetical protein